MSQKTPREEPRWPIPANPRTTQQSLIEETGMFYMTSTNLEYLFTRVYFSYRAGFTAPSKGFRSHPGYQGKGPDLPGPPMPEGVPLSRSPPAVDKVCDLSNAIVCVLLCSMCSHSSVLLRAALDSKHLPSCLVSSSP